MPFSWATHPRQGTTTTKIPQYKSLSVGKTAQVDIIQSNKLHNLGWFKYAGPWLVRLLMLQKSGSCTKYDQESPLTTWVSYIPNCFANVLVARLPKNLPSLHRAKPRRSVAWKKVRGKSGGFQSHQSNREDSWSMTRLVVEPTPLDTIIIVKWNHLPRLWGVLKTYSWTHHLGMMIHRHADFPKNMMDFPGYFLATEQLQRSLL